MVPSHLNTAHLLILISKPIRAVVNLLIMVGNNITVLLQILMDKQNKALTARLVYKNEVDQRSLLPTVLKASTAVTNKLQVSQISMALTSQVNMVTKAAMVLINKALILITKHLTRLVSMVVASKVSTVVVAVATSQANIAVTSQAHITEIKANMVLALVVGQLTSTAVEIKIPMGAVVIQILKVIIAAVKAVSMEVSAINQTSVEVVVVVVSSSMVATKANMEAMTSQVDMEGQTLVIEMTSKATNLIVVIVDFHLQVLR